MTEAAITEPRDVLGAGAGGPLSAPSPWIQYQGYIFYPAGVVIGTPIGGNKGVGTLNLNSLYLNGTIVNLGLYFPYTGGTFTGLVTLFEDPTSALHAATKQYVDNNIITVNANFASYLPLTGGTVTGPIVLPGDPTADLQATTKAYVDLKFSGLIGISDAPADGTNYSRNNNTWSNSLDLGTY